MSDVVTDPIVERKSIPIRVRVSRMMLGPACDNVVRLRSGSSLRGQEISVSTNQKHSCRLTRCLNSPRYLEHVPTSTCLTMRDEGGCRRVRPKSAMADVYILAYVFRAVDSPHTWKIVGLLGPAACGSFRSLHMSRPSGPPSIGDGVSLPLPLRSVDSVSLLSLYRGVSDNAASILSDMGMREPSSDGRER